MNRVPDGVDDAARKSENNLLQRDKMIYIVYKQHYDGEIEFLKAFTNIEVADEYTDLLSLENKYNNYKYGNPSFYTEEMELDDMTDLQTLRNRAQYYRKKIEAQEEKEERARVKQIKKLEAQLEKIK